MAIKDQTWLTFTLFTFFTVICYFILDIETGKVNAMQDEQMEILSEFEKFNNQIDAYYNNSDIEGLIKTGEEVDIQYYRQTVTICLRLGTKDLREDRQQETLNYYLKGSLGEYSSLPLKVQMSIVDFLKNDVRFSKNLNSQDCSKYRTIAAKLVFNAWNRLRRSLDKNFDMNKKPFLNVSPPIETGMPSGVTPEAIKDPVLREKYEKEIADNLIKIKYYNQQYVLHEMDKQFSDDAEKYLIDVYSKLPFALKELELFANPEILGNDTVGRLLTSVRKKVENR